MVVYIFDPDFRQVFIEIVKYKILRLTPSEDLKAINKEILKNKMNSSSENSFLFSSMNLESVCSILTGLHKVFT